MRLKWQKENTYSGQIFGFDTSEIARVKNQIKNYPDALPIYILLMYGLTKKACITIVQDAGIEVPISYKEGSSNNNCEKTGCVQGGIGYWQKRAIDKPKQVEAMAKVEHDLTDKKGVPVTCLKDQSNAAKKSGRFNVFLLPHPDYPDHKSLSDMKGRPPEPLLDCNGFGCALNDNMPINKTEDELAKQ